MGSSAAFVAPSRDINYVSSLDLNNIRPPTSKPLNSTRFVPLKPKENKLPIKWTVRNDQLERLPKIFLEKTSRFIKDADANAIASRICDCLRLRSIHATFDNTKAQAKCTTSDYVLFHVNLFAGSEGLSLWKSKGGKAVALHLIVNVGLF